MAFSWRFASTLCAEVTVGGQTHPPAARPAGAVTQKQPRQTRLMSRFVFLVILFAGILIYILFYSVVNIQQRSIAPVNNCTNRFKDCNNEGQNTNGSAVIMILTHKLMVHKDLL